MSQEKAAIAYTTAELISGLNEGQIRKDIPDFRVGDTVKVHAKIIEGNKERVQIFEGVVIKKHRGDKARGGEVSSTFTVRKISYNVGVERTFLTHSPRIEKIEIVNKGVVRRGRLYYLRGLRGKAARIKTRFQQTEVVSQNQDSTAPTASTAE